MSGNQTGNGGNGQRNLTGRVALVTSAASGVGRCISLALASRGARVAVNYRASKADAESLAELIRDHGTDCLLVQGDVAIEEEARHVVEEVLREWGRVDILVNNAGVKRDTRMRKAADDEWADLISINLNGMYHCTNAVLPPMMKQNFGRIVNISSCAGQAGRLGPARYAAGRTGIAEFTKSVALEMAKFNITANTVAPGITCTEALSKMPENILEQLRSQIPLGRFGTPEEVAKAVTFLAADGDYITGQQLGINGGLYIQ